MIYSNSFSWHLTPEQTDWNCVLSIFHSSTLLHWHVQSGVAFPEILALILLHQFELNFRREASKSKEKKYIFYFRFGSPYSEIKQRVSSFGVEVPAIGNLTISSCDPFCHPSPSPTSKGLHCNMAGKRTEREKKLYVIIIVNVSCYSREQRIPSCIPRMLSCCCHRTFDVWWLEKNFGNWY